MSMSIYCYSMGQGCSLAERGTHSLYCGEVLYLLPVLRQARARDLHAQGDTLFPTGYSCKADSQEPAYVGVREEAAGFHAEGHSVAHTRMGWAD